MAKYQKYAEYKDSGVEWLGEIPSHWKVVKLSYKLSLLSGDGITAFDIEDTGTYPVFGGNGLRGFTEKYNCDGEYALVGRQGALCGNINVARGKFFATEHAVVVYPYEKFNLTYLSEFLRFMDLGQYSVSAAQPGIAVDRINALPIVIPTLDEQNSIGDFLDHETTKIDHLIEKQKQLIELLKEKRQAVISHAVTKGLDPNVPMKDSGVEWLGEVPEHWKVAPIKRIINLMEQGKSPECENIPATSDQWGVLKTSCVNNGVFHANQNKALPENIKPHTQYQVKAGDVLMSRASGSINLIGSVALVPENVQENLLLSDKIFRIHLSKDCDSRFFTLLLATPYMRTLIERAISGAEGMANNITKTAILEFISAIPPLDEQLQLVVYLNQKIETFNSLIEKSSSAIEVMQERRTALISAVVTGKIDVRNWQAPTVAEADTELSA